MQDDDKPDMLVHVASWKRYIHYVRGDRVNTVAWRPPHVSLHVAEVEAKARDLSDAQLGSFIRLLLEYASSPLLDPSGDASGPRRLTFKHASRTLRARGKHASETWKQLEQAGLIEVLPEASRLVMCSEVMNGDVTCGDVKEPAASNGSHASGNKSGEGRVSEPKLDALREALRGAREKGIDHVTWNSVVAEYDAQDFENVEADLERGDIDHAWQEHYRLRVGFVAQETP